MATKPSKDFKKWEIIYISRFPETIKCQHCPNYYSISEHICPHCKKLNNILTNIIAKPRPFLLWLDKSNWIDSMSFGIPLSTSNLLNITKTNVLIQKNHYIFTHSKSTYNQPMRAIIHQATRVDGNVCERKDVIGIVTDKVIQEEIQNKLFEWLFP